MMLEWMISASILILVIIIGRHFLRGRISCRVRYGLWLLAALRLLTPVSLFESSLSVANMLPESWTGQEAENISTDYPYPQPAGSPYSGTAGGQYPRQAGEWNPRPADAESAPLADGGPGNNIPDEKKVKSGMESAAAAAGVIWLAGACALALWLAAVNGVFRYRVYRSRRIPAIPEKLRRELCTAAGCPEDGRRENRRGLLPLYVTDRVGSPCMYGLFFPAIYITPRVAADPRLLAMVLCHEQMHYRHGDHIWAVVRTLCLCIHWYNPLVWVAVRLSRQDGELACDEGVLQQLGQENRSSYGEALLALSAGVKPTLRRAMNLATSMSGTKRQLRERLSALVTVPRMAAGTTALVVLLFLGMTACTFTGRADDDNGSSAADAGAESGTDMAGSGQPEDVLSESQKNPEDTEDTEDPYRLSWVMAEEYTGYLDELESWQTEYRDKDYDGDGLADRIYQDVESEPGVMKMRVEFGNGETLAFDTYQNSPLMVQSMDLDGDGSRELLFTKPNDFSTNPPAIPSDILLLTRQGDGYRRVDTALRGESSEEQQWSPLETYMAVSCNKEDDSHIRVSWTVPGVQGDLGKTQIYLRPADEETMEYYEYSWGGWKHVPAYNAELIQERYAFLRLYFEGLSRSGDEIWVDLALEDGKLSPISSIYVAWIDGEEVELEPEEAGAVYDSWDVQTLEYFDEEGRPVAKVTEGDRVTKLTYVEASWSYSALNVQFSHEKLYWACQALRELEEWTGTRLTEVCYSMTEFGDFLFAQTPEDIIHSRSFYSRTYNSLLGSYDVIESVDYTTDMDVWYSPVKQYVTPPGYDRMTTEEILIWYFERSTIARGSKAEEIFPSWGGTYVIRTDQETYYEFHTGDGTADVGRGMCLYGPYDSYPLH